MYALQNKVHQLIKQHIQSKSKSHLSTLSYPYKLLPGDPKSKQQLPYCLNMQSVTLGPGVRLDVRFLGVASVLGFLLLPPATQMCGKRVLGVM